MCSWIRNKTKHSSSLKWNELINERKYYRFGREKKKKKDI